MGLTTSKSSIRNDKSLLAVTHYRPSMINKTSETRTVVVNSLDELNRHPNHKINTFLQNEYIMQRLTLNSCYHIVFIDTQCNSIYEIFNNSGRRCTYVTCINVDQI